MNQSSSQIGTLEILGIAFSTGSMNAATDELVRAVINGERGHVCVANVDMFTRAIRTPRLRAVMNSARLVVSDGMPLIWLQRRLGMDTERVYGPDFMVQLCRRAQGDQIPVFLYGGSDGLLLQLTKTLKRSYPDLRIVGGIAPPMLPQEPPLDVELAMSIRRSGARLVFVGLGCPKQEFWMQTHGEHIDAVMIGVGLAFAQIAGAEPRAPSWMQRCGMEWIFRLLREPRRLWKRYLIGNTIFVAVATVALIGHYARRLRPPTRT
jgi:N-acetylglucosaminyldiphosphoundecaprenol N-acetyl-beta-D-mannosaminyltransferase